MTTIEIATVPDEVDVETVLLAPGETYTALVGCEHGLTRVRVTA